MHQNNEQLVLLVEGSQQLGSASELVPPNGQGLAAASRPTGTAFKLESGPKIAPILARSGRLQPVVRRRRTLFTFDADKLSLFFSKNYLR
jgi:hypothetical protein